MMRRLGESAHNILIAQGNLANTYYHLGRFEEALRLRRDVYSGRLKLNGEEYDETLRAANNYTVSLKGLQRFKEAKSLLRKTIPVARRVLGDNDRLTLKMRRIYAQSLYKNDDATLDDLREATTTLEEAEQTARRVFGSAHPLVADFGPTLRDARTALRSRETPPPGRA